VSEVEMLPMALQGDYLTDITAITYMTNWIADRMKNKSDKNNYTKKHEPPIWFLGKWSGQDKLNNMTKFEKYDRAQLEC
jgi:hypothetical protein